MLKFLVAASLALLAVEAATQGPEVVEAPPWPTVDWEAPVVGSIDGISLRPQLLVDGLSEPTDVVADPLGDRLFVVEKPGTIVIVSPDGSVADTPFLDLTRFVGSEGNEQGLLSLRFHPGFEENGRLFLFFTDRNGDSRLAEARVDLEEPDRVLPSSLRLVATFPQWHQYHQSGSMFFGPDGNLWLSLGDGGGIGDPFGNGQNTEEPNASILRIDVDHGRPYAIPDDNPFVGTESIPELWAYGVRNPWRISYDGASGLLYIPDVGQEGVEELNVVPVDQPGLNFGWSVTEGFECFAADDCDKTGFTFPVYQFEHNGNGCAMIGGQVYRGPAEPELHGHFFMADYCLGWVRSVVVDPDQTYLVVDWTPDPDDRLGTATTIGSDRAGELYLANLEGELFRLAFEGP